MPVAVPTGRYDVAARVDLSPFFGVVSHRGTVEITAPGPGILDQRLKELASEDKEVRQRAVFDLFHFREDGDRIFPVLLGLLDDPDPEFRGMVISVMGAFPKQAVKHVDRFVAIVADGEACLSARSAAAWILAQYAPENEKVENCLTDLAESEEPELKGQFKWPLKTYRQRVKGETGGLGIEPATPAEPDAEKEAEPEAGKEVEVD